jgi:hypothetical protein
MGGFLIQFQQRSAGGGGGGEPNNSSVEIRDGGVLVAVLPRVGDLNGKAYYTAEADFYRIYWTPGEFAAWQYKRDGESETSALSDTEFPWQAHWAGNYTFTEVPA